LVKDKTPTSIREINWIPSNPDCPVCKHPKCVHHKRRGTDFEMVCFGNAFSGGKCSCDYKFILLDREKMLNKKGIDWNFLPL